MHILHNEMPETVFIINIRTNKSVHVLLSCLSYDVVCYKLAKRTVIDGKLLSKGPDQRDNIRTAFLTTRSKKSVLNCNNCFFVRGDFI